MTKTTTRRAGRTTNPPAVVPTPLQISLKFITAKTPRANTKMAALVALLSTPEGATIAAMRELTGWQDHSVRGVLAGALKIRFGLTIASVKEAERGRVYRAVAPTPLSVNEVPLVANEGAAETQATAQ